MKKSIKILFTALMLALFLITASIPAFAAETADNQTEAESAFAETSTDENIFTMIYTEAASHAAEIFSFLSLVGTVIISWFYKRGLLPSVKGTLSNLGSAVGKIKESSDRQCKAQIEDAEKTSRRLSEFENTLSLYGENLKALEEHLISEEKMRLQREKTDRILAAQIDMLYDIFMTSSIPHYQKEATGERINKMRKEIEGYENSQNS